jgi:uncharacterized membrane protein
VRAFRVPWWGDLAAVAGLALAGLALALVPVPGPLRTAALLPLLLILPGYALAAALFRPGEIGRELRVVLSVAFSFGASALGGLVAQLVLRLDRPVWATLLALVTVLAAVVALLRRDAMPADSEPPRLSLPRVRLASLLAMLAAIAIAGGAIASATGGVHRQLDGSRFSSLSLVPSGPSGTAPPVRIGVSNHEGRPVAYRVSVRQAGRTVKRWRFRLDANHGWQARLTASAISGTGPVTARLDRDGRLCHRVALRIRGNS